MDYAKKKTYTLEDIYALPDGRRAELIDGQIYDMAPPTTLHQRIVFRLAASINDHIQKKKGSCEVFVAPFAVFLNADDKNYVEPDISVICNKDLLSEHGYHGAPDWVAEIASPGTERMDYGIKLFKYRTAGVREYWIINPTTSIVNVYDLEHDEKTRQYSFQDDIPVCIYDDLVLNIGKLL